LPSQKKINHALPLLRSFMHFFCAFAWLIACLIGTIYAVENEKAPSTIELDGRKWILGSDLHEPGKTVREYILQNENIQNWTELFSIQDFTDIDMSPVEFFNLFVQGLKQAVPKNKVESRIINQSDNSLLGEWWIQDKSLTDQHEWVRLIKNNNDMMIVRYTTKKLDQVEKMRKEWEKRLENVQPNQFSLPKLKEKR
jgi:hypothetical protein